MIPDDKTRIVQYRLERARTTLNEIPLLLENELWNTAINRMYYASFYAITALLLAYDFETKTHTGSRQMFGLHFIKNGKISVESGMFYKDIFASRQTGDYGDLFVFEQSDVLPLLPRARQLITEIEQLLREDPRLNP